ncbi:MAG: hypothetical protein HYX24_02995 [Candidatus Aenigmarchaeota archaeon]|nr:hypothetical protein [Candidatus Aenigmarchaeota archaeon]
MEDSYGAGYVCGALCSRGFIVWNKKYSNYCIALETGDEGFAKMFYENLAGFSKKLPKMGLNKRHYKGSLRQTTTVKLWGKKHVKLLAEKWGLRTGRDRWQVPEAAFRDEAFGKGFLKGFFDGRGNMHVRIFREKGTGKVKKSRSIRISSVNKNGIERIKILLNQEGIKALLYQSLGNTIMEIHGKANLQQFEAVVGFSMPERQAILKEALMPLSIAEEMKGDE